jgi:hypothetical protein
MRTSANGNTKNQVTLDEAQTISGAKTFSSNIVANGGTGIIGNVTGNITGNITGNVTGNITSSVGSASSPSLTFSGNTNTGIFQGSSNSLSVTTDGTERVRVSNNGLSIESGQLVIPTTTPASPINGSIWIS